MAFYKEVEIPVKGIKRKYPKGRHRKKVKFPGRKLKPGETGVWSPPGSSGGAGISEGVPGGGAGAGGGAGVAGSKLASVVAFVAKEERKTREPYHSLDPHDGEGEDDGW